MLLRALFVILLRCGIIKWRQPSDAGKDCSVLSQLGPLFKTHLRQAEHADTRLEIRRDEKHDQGKKQEYEAQDEDTGALWEDSTAVSVEALRTFLIEFLKSRGDEVPEAGIPLADGSIGSGMSPEYRPPISTRAAQAVKAYSSMQAQMTPPTMPPEPSKSAPAVDLVDLLHADEIRTMHVLITELDALWRKGIQTLIINKAETFLEALVLAVRLEKEKA